jgi:hypothetical protein
MITIAELKRQGQADRACGSFAQLLKTIREVDEDEARNERLALEFAWEDYAEELTQQYYAAREAALVARNSNLVAALERLEADGVREELNARIVDLGGAKWSVL